MHGGFAATVTLTGRPKNGHLGFRTIRCRQSLTNQSAKSGNGQGCVETREVGVFEDAQTIPDVSIVDPGAI
jgi:hypothetical protein